MEMLEEQNHLFRLKASAGVLNKNPSRTMQMGHMKVSRKRNHMKITIMLTYLYLLFISTIQNESGRNLTISFSNPVSVVSY